METELATFIRSELGQGKHRLEIEQELLAKGWLAKDVQGAFAEILGIDSQTIAIDVDEQERSRRAKYALASLYTIIAHLIAYIFSPTALLLTVAIGIILSGMGMRSTRRMVAVVSMVIHVLVLCIAVFGVYIAIHVMTHGTYPGGVIVTEEEYKEMGIEKSEYQPLLEKNGIK
ncbi:MAG: hypothetical protein KBD24_01875 [Candidatus Pacebacteria bacterium]|nr:hypothetical protein [Candidatus Paceibacterota bacterium]